MIGILVVSHEPLGTALIGFCPLYPLLGLNTCPAGRSAT